MTTTAVSPFSLSSFWSNLEGAVTGDVQSWLIQEYATLQAMPNTLRQYASVQAQLAAIPAVATDPTLGPTVSQIGVSIQGLISGYPAMIGPVNTAVTAVQAAQNSGVTITTGADIAIAAATAQQFTMGVSTVQSQLLDLVNAALASGAITPAQATALTANVTTINNASWVKYALWAMGLYVGYRVIKKVL
ncbi:MAG TPA: hypothetical protein VGL62_11930 [Vicinamibacterales bacterium]